MVDINNSFNFFIDKVYVKSKNENKDLTDYKLAKGKDLLLNYPEYFLQDFEKLYQYYEGKFSSSLVTPLLNPNIENKFFNHKRYREVSIGFKIRTHSNNPTVCDVEALDNQKLFCQMKKQKVVKLMHILKSYKLLLEQAVLEKGNFSETDIHFFEETLIKLEKGEVSLSFTKDGRPERCTIFHFVKEYGSKDFYVDQSFYLPNVSHELINKFSKSYEASLTVKDVIYKFSFKNLEELKKFKEQILEGFIKELDQITEENTNVKKLEKKKVDGNNKKSYT